MKLLFSLIFLFTSASSFAFRLDPMSASIELKDNQTYFNFIIENETNQPLPVQISLYERGMKENGEDDLKETEEISAFPDQLIIPPEQKRSVKVTWNGKSKDLKVEKAFRFVAEQLPLDLKKSKTEKSGIKMLLKYVAALYVTPAEAEPKVDCLLDEKSTLLCENKGSKHQILTFKSLSLSDGKKKIDLSKEDLRKISGENALVGTTRKLNLSFLSEVKTLKAPVKVNFKFE
jgi:fimbrial chaperone protein